PHRAPAAACSSTFALHDALPISRECDLALVSISSAERSHDQVNAVNHAYQPGAILLVIDDADIVTPTLCWRHPAIRGVVVKSARDRKSTRLNYSHVSTSYAFFCF